MDPTRNRLLPAQRGEGADFWGLWLPKFIFSQQDHPFGVFLIKPRAHDSKIWCSKHGGSRGKAEAPLEFLLEPSGFDSPKLIQGLPCPYWNHRKAGIVYSSDSWGMMCTAERHFPLLSLGCLGLGCRRGGVPEPWRLLQCHTPGKSILAPKNPFPWHCSDPQRPKKRQEELLGTWREGGGKANSATKSLLCSLIFIEDICLDISSLTNHRFRGDMKI